MKISKKTDYAETKIPRTDVAHSEWSYEGAVLNVHRNETFADEFAGPAVASEQSSSAESMTEYLSKHSIRERVEEAINHVLASRPADPLCAIASALQSFQTKKPATKAAAVPAATPPAAAAPAAPAVDVAALEGELKVLGEKIRAMKEAIKADPAAHTKEALDAEVAAFCIPERIFPPHEDVSPPDPLGWAGGGAQGA